MFGSLGLGLVAAQWLIVPHTASTTVNVGTGGTVTISSTTPGVTVADGNLTCPAVPTINTPNGSVTLCNISIAATGVASVQVSEQGSADLTDKFGLAKGNGYPEIVGSFPISVAPMLMYFFQAAEVPVTLTPVLHWGNTSRYVSPGVWTGTPLVGGEPSFTVTFTVSAIGL
jgi:hypothetical protein